MKNTIRIAAVVAAFVVIAGLTISAFAATGGSGSQTNTPSVPTATDSPSDDPKGTPSDDATPSDDPTGTPSDGPTASASSSVDISGNCDEAEHANDPECLNGTDQDDDNSGPGSHGDDDEGDHDNSGRGSHGDDDDRDDDNSGPGSHGDDDGGSHGDDDDGNDDNSGPGGHDD